MRSKINKYIFIKSIVFLCVFNLQAQEIITSERAVKLTLENNYGIKVTKNNIDIAKNNSSILNNDYLPTITANAGANYNLEDTDAEFSNGETTEISGAESSRYNASIGLNYTLFDGFGRKYNYEKFKEEYNLSELEARKTIENTILQLYSIYYNVSQITLNTKSFKTSLKISKERVKRASYQFDYGQNTKLGVLNAELDYNNDSIQLINITQQLINSKRSLKAVLGNVLKKEFDVETKIDFKLLDEKSVLFEKAKKNNIDLLSIEKNITLKQLDLKLIHAEYFPKLNLNTSYGWNKNNNNAASFLTTLTSNGLSAGLNLTWNLFEGKSGIANKNRKLNLSTEKLKRDNFLIELTRDFDNSWDDYKNKLLVYNIQENNIKTAQNNFDRTQEKFKLGQVNSIEFRQAQLNLLNFEINRNNAKFEAKLAELQVLYLSGELLNNEF